MGNLLSQLVLIGWPVITAVLFSRLAYREAAIWTVLAGYLLLPPVVGIKVPLVPALTKDEIIALCAMIGVWLLRDNAPIPWIRLEGWIKVLLALSIITPFVTMATNGEPLIEGASYRPGLGVVDGINTMLVNLLNLLPFLIGYMVLSSAESIRILLRIMVVATLAYSLPMLLEVRLSPQLNVWIYGFFAHDFSQSIRYGGFRPMVFLPHGLWVAIFAMSGVLAAAVALRNAQAKEWWWALLILTYLLFVLILCKSVASLMYAVLLTPVILLLAPRWQMRIAALLAMLVLIYPLAFWMDFVPVTEITDEIINIDEDRGHSLRFRFNNEQELVNHASQKILAGWGDWGRNMLVDPNNGEFSTVADGLWIIVISMNGILGYFATFGLLCGSVIRIWGASIASGYFDRWTAALMLIVAANLVDLIPNATLTPLSMLAMGALAGTASRGVEKMHLSSEALTSKPRHPPLSALIGGPSHVQDKSLLDTRERPLVLLDHTKNSIVIGRPLPSQGKEHPKYGKIFKDIAGPY